MLDALERYRWLIVAVFSLPLVLAIAFLVADRLDGPQPLVLDLDDLPAEDIRIYVAGAVRYPGVYALEPGDRWIDALEAAGGATDDADLTAVDLARRARDEDTVLVPSLDRTAAASVVRPPLIDINAASADTLETLPGIGEVRAAAIVRAREEDGPFESIDELLERELVPAAVFDEIADLITAGGAAGDGGP